jgi:hypothetical protein
VKTVTGSDLQYRTNFWKPSAQISGKPLDPAGLQHSLHPGRWLGMFLPFPVNRLIWNMDDHAAACPRLWSFHDLGTRAIPEITIEANPGSQSTLVRAQPPVAASDVALHCQAAHGELSSKSACLAQRCTNTRGVRTPEGDQQSEPVT